MDLRFHTPLSADEQTAHGLETPQTLAMADRVRFSELDILQHVNNKAYLDWFEVSRVAYFNQFCLPHFEGQPRPRNVLRNANVHYVQEMLLGEAYIATSQVLRFRRTSYVMEQQIWSGGTLRCRMEGVMVLRTPDGREGYPVPESLISFWTKTEGALRDS
ncbi:acyl-CoA thioesterase [Epibacterium sp. SM1979]|uniref:Acyl-CoA thioesterase n=1 Tax=Tritonibacter litoralis TaxID=2662264 RepID=A0A843YDX2_9RHOB|nr:acyl-CoA thioesterase [Tritonibacter litoralis]MQQ07067.1 acyl-CoA thioesterase [Tritonibacter litoralis]